MPLRNAFRAALTGVGLASLFVVAGCGDRLAGSADEPGARPLGSPPASVPDHLVAEIAAGWTDDQINTTFGTQTIAVIAGSPYALLLIPAGETFETLSTALLSAGACSRCQPNYIVSTPEAEQASISFYEGSLTQEDVADQEAMGRVRAPQGRLAPKGGGTSVAIVDTGIDASHPTLAPVVRTDGWDFVAGDADPHDEYDSIDQDLDGLTDEGAGHGTHVAGIVNFIAPKATLLPVRVLDSEGNGTIFSMAQGVDHATAAGVDVINLSLALDAESAVAEYVIQAAHAAGILVVASAGNDNVQTSTHFPASMPEVMGVAAVDASDLKASFSNYGTVAAIGAPGSGIVSTYLFQGYASWSGTSMAAPFISGTAALLYRLSPTLGPDGIRLAIEQSATPYDHAGQPYEGQMGAGRIDVLRAVLSTDPR